MADLLQDQFVSAFSDPDLTHKKSPSFDPPNIVKPLKDEDFIIHDDDILEAINDIKSDSAAVPDGIPAILLKNCAPELCKPLKLFWSQSHHLVVIPKFYKTSNVPPQYKKGYRAYTKNYRPISLTSHVIKIYKRILRKTLVKFVDDNNILCPHQHGFRSGRSCLTQLLAHFDDIMLGLLDNKDTDSIYLDYEKAFDKVDHALLLEKLRLYGLPPKLIDWIASFLTDCLS